MGRMRPAASRQRGQSQHGSEVTTEDSLRIKQRKGNVEISDLGVQNAPTTECGTANAEISESGVHEHLRIVLILGQQPLRSRHRECKGHLVLILD